MSLDEDENDQAFDAMGRDYICRILGAPLYIDDFIEQRVLVARKV